MSKDLTNSPVDRQNILNNPYALAEMETATGLQGIPFEGRHVVLKEQVASFFEVTVRTVENYLEKFSDELTRNGYEVLTGKRLKDFKLVIQGRDVPEIDFGSMAKVSQLSILEFKGFLNLAMLLAESERARVLRQIILDIVIDTINARTGGGTKYINQRDEEFLQSSFVEENYRKQFTDALDHCVNMGKAKYAIYTDKIYVSIYRLDAVDAYNRGLVKTIEVAAARVESGHNKAYLRFLGVKQSKGTITARVEVDVQKGKAVQRKEITMGTGSLELETGRDIYTDIQVNDFGIGPDDQPYLSLSNLERPLKVGEAIGALDNNSFIRQLFARTIEEHLKKELRLRPQGIKVLTLFFIDRVDNYRRYDDEGNRRNGPYADIFEEEYRRAAKLPQYRTLFNDVDLVTAPADVHDGYFSKDKKKVGKRTVEVDKDTNGGTKADDEAYKLIMEKKEELLSFAKPLKFIFSHSALREGWDNPNVFQICSLREMGTERERRQTIGRGLRICVNQDGDRVRAPGVNTLTVIASETFEQFAEALQVEIEQDTGIRFGIVEDHQFANIPVVGADGQAAPLGVEKSETLWSALKVAGYVDAKGKVQDKLRQALKTNTLVIPADFQAQQPAIEDILRKLAGKLDIKNADDKSPPIKLRKQVLLSPDFQALWDRIKYRTSYEVDFDPETLVTQAAKAFADGPPIKKTHLEWRTADLAIGRGGVTAAERGTARTVIINESDLVLPDLLTDLQERTHLTRKSLVRILKESGRMDDFPRNPQQFIELAAECINRTKRTLLVDGIKYHRLGDAHFYAQSLFESQELTGYLTNMLAVQKSIYEHLIYDSDTEANFAGQLEENEAVMVFCKLPAWFKVPTPLGNYNPDWALVIEQDGEQKLYFVVETKHSLFADDIREREEDKIKCGRAHFAAIARGERPARFTKATNLADVLL